MSDLWRDMVFRKSHVSELKTGCLSIHKEKPSVRVEIRAGGGLRPEKPGWSAGDTRKWPQKKCLGFWFLQGSFVIFIVNKHQLDY